MKTQIDNLGKVSITCEGQWEFTREYDRLCLVHDGFFASYISKKHVPKGINLENEEYWQPVANLRDDVKLHLSEFEKKVITLIASIQLKLKSARIVVNTDKEREALTVNEVAPGCEVYVLENKQTWILDSIVVGGNYKTWYLEVDGKIDSEEKYELEGQFDNLTSDRAICDAYGNIIHDTYITRDTIHNFVDSVISDFLKNFKLDITDGSITYDDLSEQVKQLLGNKNKITNFPDEEDITIVNKQLKFKDRTYQKGTFNGMGYKILRKNMMGQINLLEQSMINEPNTIYEIRYDFCLDGKTITIPENCILKFNGGSIRNGNIIIKKDTNITRYAKFINIKFDIKVSNSWDSTISNLEIWLDWFGLYYYDKIDNRTYYNFNKSYNIFIEAFENIILNSYINIILNVPINYYIIEDSIFLYPTFNIDFHNSTFNINKCIDKYAILYNINKENYYNNIDNENEQEKYIQYSYSLSGELPFFRNIIVNGVANGRFFLSVTPLKFYNIGVRNSKTKDFILFYQPFGNSSYSYLDGLILENIHLGTPYQTDFDNIPKIYTNLGDGKEFKNITGGHIIIENCHGITVKNCINTAFTIKNSIISLHNLHNEFNDLINISQSIVSIHDSILFQKGNTRNYDDKTLITINDLNGLENATSSTKSINTFLTLSNVLFDNTEGYDNLSETNRKYNIIVNDNFIGNIIAINSYNVIHSSIFKIHSNTYIKHITGIINKDKLWDTQVNKDRYCIQITGYKDTSMLDSNISEYASKDFTFAYRYFLKNRNIIVLGAYNLHYLNSSRDINRIYTTIKIKNYKFNIITDIELLFSDDAINGEIYNKRCFITDLLSYGVIIKNKGNSYNKEFINIFKNDMDGYPIEDCSINKSELHNSFSNFWLNYDDIKDSIFSYDVDNDLYSIEVFNENAFNYFYNIKEFKNGDSLVYNSNKYIFNSECKSFIIDDIIIIGNTSSRPTNIPVGFQYFDTTLNKPIWWNGSAWIDSTGATV